MRNGCAVGGLVLATAMALSSAAQGQTPMHGSAQGMPPAAVSTEPFKPYLQVKPVAGEADTVRAFFSPSCPFSRRYFGFFKNLKATLPEGKTFAFTPLVNKGDGISYALSFIAVERYYPAYVDNFVEASMVGAQDLGISTRNWAGIERIGKAAHLPVPVPLLVQQHQAEVSKMLMEALQRQKAFAVTNTPAVTVAGTYIVTPEFTNGDSQLFSQLVNGIISMP
jgi:hypothetical protein